MNVLFIQTRTTGAHGHFLPLVFVTFCSLILKPFSRPLTFTTHGSYSFWFPRVSQSQKCQRASVMVILATVVTRAAGAQALERGSGNGKQGLCLFSVHWTPSAGLYSQGEVGEEVTEPSEALAVTLGMRSGWHMLRSQGSALECWLLSSWFSSWPLFLLLLQSVLRFSPLSWSLPPWPVPGSHNTELRESTLKPQKEARGGGAQILHMAGGRPWALRGFAVAPRTSLVGRATSGHSGHLPYTSNTSMHISQVYQALQTRCLACPRLTGLPTKQRYSHPQSDAAHHLQAFPNSPGGWGTHSPCALSTWVIKLCRKLGIWLISTLDLEVA